MVTFNKVLPNYSLIISFHIFGKEHAASGSQIPHPRKNALQMFPTDVSLHIPLRTNIVQGKAGVTPPNFTKSEAEIKPYSVTPNNWVNMFLTFQSSTIHYFRPLSDV